MLQVTKLKPKALDFIQLLGQKGRSRSVLFSFLLAKRLSANLPLPTSAVEDLNKYYLTVIKVDVWDIINELNELLSLDADLVLDFVEKFYGYRVQVLSNFARDGYTSKQSLLTIFGISDFFPAVVLSEVERELAKVSELNAGLRDLFNDLELEE